MTSGATALSTYLIPYSLRTVKNREMDLLFNEKESLLTKKEIEVFKKDEKEKVEKTSKLLKELSKAVKDSKEFRDLIITLMENLMKSISQQENNLQKIYKRHLEVMRRITQLSKELTSKQLEKLKRQSDLESVKHSLNLLKELDKAIESWTGSLTNFIEAIDEAKKNNNSAAEGGALNKKELQVAKLKKS